MLQHSRGWQDKVADGITIRRVSGAAVTIALCGVVVKLCSFGATVLIAAFFGTGDDLEAYYIAFLLPSLIVGVISGSISLALIPTYVRVFRQQGAGSAQALFSRVMLSAVGCLCVGTGLFAFSFPHLLPVLASGFGPSKVVLTQNLFYFLLPAILLKGTTEIYASVLQSHKRFSLVALAPVMVPLASIITILVWSDPQTRIYAVAIGTTLGMFAELSVVAIAMKWYRLPIRPRWCPRSSASRRVIARAFPLAVGSLIVCGSYFVDQSMAAALPAGSIASLSYGSKLVGVIISIAATGIGTAVLPFFSSLAERKNWAKLRRLLTYYLRLILLSTPVVSVGLLFISEPLVNIALERGLFDASDTSLVGKIQAIYALQIPFILCSTVLVRVISATTSNQVLVLVGVLNLFTNAALNYIFMQRWGVVGIALSTSCVGIVSFTYMTIFVYHRLWTHHRKSACQTAAEH